MCWNPPKYNRSIPDITLASRHKPVLYSKSTRVALYYTYLYYTLSLKATSNFWIAPSKTNQFYLRHSFTGSSVLTPVCLFVGLFFSRITKKVMGQFLWNSENKEIMDLGRLIIFWKWSGTYFGYRTFYHPYDCIGFARRGHYGRLRRL